MSDLRYPTAFMTHIMNNPTTEIVGPLIIHEKFYEEWAPYFKTAGHEVVKQHSVPEVVIACKVLTPDGSTRLWDMRIPDFVVKVTDAIKEVSDV